MSENERDLLRKLGVRPTHRTWRVLAAIGDLSESHPPTNREIAAAAGITNDGQASKMLKRLERLGLLENRGVGAVHGKPNAWGLTAKGNVVRWAIEAQTPKAHQ
jgi:DNA-binding IclR family transcriptional regulator